VSAAHNAHASAVAFGPRGGVLILGPSGSGKSTLALALISEGAQLVSDDQVLLSGVSGNLYARAPQSIAGLIEARGLGLIQLAYRRLTQIALIIDLTDAPTQRLPEPQTRTLHGVTRPCLSGRADTPFAQAISHYVARYSH
jgi:HPr kinase/phosphorylase